MCGIAGICNIKKSHPILRATIEKMTGALHHRGPDETGIFLDDRIGLGHARLSIIDLSGGSQPIHNEDKTLWIVYNGEVFNYPELREELLKKGHTFSTSSDTEVIIHLYEEKGASCLDDLIGQFAFAIWNSEKRELFIARDRVGIRPLHYTIKNDKLIFASEIKSIFTADSSNQAIDSLAIDQIFTFWTTLPGKTAFQDIHELPPGHYMTISNGIIDIQKYWEIPLLPAGEKLDWTEQQISDKIQELFYDAVRIRLRADVPVGTYLSGGLDSSGVSALVAKKFNNSVKTFGIRFEEKEFDEGDEQRQMVKFLNVDHREIHTSNNDIRTAFPDVIWHTEKPMLRTAPTPLFLLSELVRNNNLKVVLTGEGADEVFGGYNIFREAKVRRFWARQPDSEFRFLLLQKLYPYVFKNKRLAGMLKSFFGRGLDKTDDPLFSHSIRWANTARMKYLFSDDLKSAIGSYDGYDELLQSLPEAFYNADHFSQAQYLEMSLFLSNYLLSSQGDRIAMAHSLEIRLPYLDHRIIEFMAQVHAKWKIRGIREKYILKKSFQDILPETIVKRSKHPYRAPINQSLLHEDIQEMLSAENIQTAGIFNPDGVQSLIEKLKHARHTSEVDDMAFVGIISTQLVHNQFIASFREKTIPAISPTVVVDKRKVRSD